VRHYLSQVPRQLPSRALYDALGSALFDAICELPWYPLTRAERRLLAVHRTAIFRSAALPTRIVELGPGNGSKLALFLDEPTAAQHVRRVELVDVSASALRDAARRLRDNTSAVINTHQMRYEQGLAAVRKTASTDDRTLVMFLGSNIGNFDPDAASAFLRGMSSVLGHEDSVLLGADLVKPEADLLLAYDDPLGVTAAFNKNLLLHVNNELGASFDVSAFDHRAIWNEAARRMEMHLVSRRRQRVDVPGAGLSLTFERDEAIWTESSYKYTPADIERMLADAGMAMTRHWIDREGQFLLALARRR
jgi:dimethylhistidine N-methyltransferase